VDNLARDKVEILFNLIRWRVRAANTVQEHLDRATVSAGLDGKHLTAAAWDRAEDISFEQALQADIDAKG